MTVDDFLASSPFTADGLDRDLLIHLQGSTGISGKQDGWPSPARTDSSFFWVAFWERPTPQSRPDLGDHELSRLQEQWDTAAAKFRHYLEGHRERVQERRAVETARQQQIAAAENDALRTELRAGYFSVVGATEAGFEAALPALIEERRRQAALANASSPARPLVTLQEMH